MDTPDIVEGGGLARRIVPRLVREATAASCVTLRSRLLAPIEGCVAGCPQVKKIDAKDRRRPRSEEAWQQDVCEDTMRRA
jgi:hypothetical protein